jgi:hypothetical protein
MGEGLMAVQKGTVDRKGVEFLRGSVELRLPPVFIEV